MTGNNDDYTPVTDIRGFLAFIEKNRLFYVDEVRKWTNDFLSEKISLSKFTELLNEKFFNWYQKQTLDESSIAEEAIGEEKFIQFIDWKEQQFNYDGKNDKGESLFVDRQNGKFSTTSELYNLYKQSKK